MNDATIDFDGRRQSDVRMAEARLQGPGIVGLLTVIRVLVVDDHPIVRLGLIRLIEIAWPDAVIDQADSVTQAKMRVAAAVPQIITLDLSLPDSEGTEALSHMLRAARDVPILVVSQSKEATHAQRVMQMGAAGYLSKDRTGDELVGAMERILQGGRYVTPDMADRLLAMLEGKSPTALPHEALTTQEYRVMQLIASGMRASRIAETMHLSVKTVANYRARILEKTGWRNNIELTKYCVQHGLTNSG
jgi:two-component system, NarL family, invasion response regulator UvrY